MALTPEGRVKKAVKEWLKARDVFFFMPVSNGMGQVGIPDFICCADGYFLAIETKAPGKRKNTTPNQDRVITAIHKSGGAAIVIDDVRQLEDMDVWRTK